MLVEFLIGMVAGCLGGVLVYAGLARRVYNLQCDVATLQERLLQEKNQRAALTRHRAKEMVEELKDLQTSPQQPVFRNPLGKFKIGG